MSSFVPFSGSFSFYEFISLKPQRHISDLTHKDPYQYLLLS